MPFYFKPHTPEWFKALEDCDPDKAQITRMAIEYAGHAEVCSICGDGPAEDYELIDINMPTNAVATIRLCEVCFIIKTELYNESFIEFEPEADRSEGGSPLTRYIRSILRTNETVVYQYQPRERLEKLKELRESDLITEQEYETKKASILKDL